MSYWAGSVFNRGNISIEWLCVYIAMIKDVIHIRWDLTPCAQWHHSGVTKVTWCGFYWYLGKHETEGTRLCCQFVKGWTGSYKSWPVLRPKQGCSVKATFLFRVEWVRHYDGLIAGVDRAQCILEGKQWWNCLCWQNCCFCWTASVLTRTRSVLMFCS